MKLNATPILTVRHQGRVALGGDGQVSLGDTIMKADAMKIRRLLDGQVITGFAGGSADAFALLERLEGRLKDHPGNIPRAATELAKEWRTDRRLRRLEALLCVADTENSFIISGNGDVIEPEDNLMAIGSGGPFAQAAALALVRNTKFDAAKIVEKALHIAGDICVYTNQNIIIETLDANST